MVEGHLRSEHHGPLAGGRQRMAYVPQYALTQQVLISHGADSDLLSPAHHPLHLDAQSGLRVLMRDDTVRSNVERVNRAVVKPAEI